METRPKVGDRIKAKIEHRGFMLDGLIVEGVIEKDLGDHFAVTDERGNVILVNENEIIEVIDDRKKPRN